MNPIPEKIEDLGEWINQNKNNYLRNVDSSICNKWRDYYYYNETPLPCCCKIRTGDCIFLECFYKVEYAKELVDNKKLYISALNSYKAIQHNSAAIMEWVIDNEALYNNVIHLNPQIRVMTQLYPHKSHYIKLPQQELKEILEFKNVFIKHFYSEEYENY